MYLTKTGKNVFGLKDGTYIMYDNILNLLFKIHELYFRSLVKGGSSVSIRLGHVVGEKVQYS